MRFPKDQIKENQYTSNGDFVEKISNKLYSGYYWEINGRYFVGKTANTNSTELKKMDVDELNRLNILNRISSSTARILGDNNINNLAIDFGDNMNSTIPIGGDVRYFAKQTTVIPTIIKEIDQDTFNKLKSNPVYQTISIDTDSIGDEVILDNIEKTFFGIKAFLSQNTF